MYHGRSMRSASPCVRVLADTEGLTLLGAAAFTGKANVMRALLDAQASPERGNWRGLTPLEMAEREGFPRLFSDLALVASRCQVVAAPVIPTPEAGGYDMRESDGSLLAESDVSLSVCVSLLAGIGLRGMGRSAHMGGDVTAAGSGADGG